ncbi:MAG: peptidyl-prolyl cis-trans isomerase [Kordiimonadaceae bacterium]|nr:peptidyl-prolyl cis-trans isomerase [Kordiimonadaceae bacterium]
MKTLFREPIVHFLVAGILLYGILALVSNPNGAGDDGAIVVSENTITTYMQFQKEEFSAGDAARALAALPPQERATLELDYIRSEALYREALALGLDQNDEEIRERLIEKISFVIASTAATESEPSTEALKAYFKKNTAAYTTPAEASFIHIFFNAKLHGMTGAYAKAELLLAELSEDLAPQATAKLGDRFHFLRTYASRPRTMVEAHFGTEMSGSIFKGGKHNAWIGPFWSRYGAHLVKISGITPETPETFTDVKGQILRDYKKNRQAAALQKATDRLVKKYSVARPKKAGR